MKTIKYKYSAKDYKKSLQFLSKTDLIVDIETLGFSSEKLPIYLIGTAYPDNDSIILTLFFAETEKEETELLQAFFVQLKGFSRIITFNGDRFDLPYIFNRTKIFNIEDGRLLDPVNENRIASLDIYRAIRGRKNLFSLSNFNQKSLEGFLGIEREDEYDGGKLISVYRRYEKNKNEEDERLLLLHNRDDLLGLFRILPLLSYDKIAFSIDDDLNLDWDFDEKYLYIGSTLKHPLPKPIRLKGESYYFIFEEDKAKAALSVYEGYLCYFYPYPSQYVYLLREETIVPKALATSIPASRKRPANREECYVQAFGHYLEVDDGYVKENKEFFSKEKLFKKSLKENKSFIKITDDSLDKHFLCSYLNFLIKNHRQKQ